jgi:hypothetical protein
MKSIDLEYHSVFGSPIALTLLFLSTHSVPCRESLPIRACQAYDGSVVPAPTPALVCLCHLVGCLMPAVPHRSEKRTSLTVRVDLCSLDVRDRTQEALTENVSAHGARVVSSNPWKRNVRLNLRSLPGDFRARARVVYCQPLGRDSYAIGLQLLAASGGWQ